MGFEAMGFYNVPPRNGHHTSGWPQRQRKRPAEQVMGVQSRIDSVHLHELEYLPTLIPTRGQLSASRAAGHMQQAHRIELARQNIGQRIVER